ncbi:hypothetical protein AU255_08265 [Methyloprofundus sedimenti]|uniref:Uncharacterized protein n=1 Tax=Methyloprofundus sedimenti TaxID=1420851 RepID=A0A1V8M8J8_9GAMM|nr:hypothetical protein AU255_08265 [Methyloprofundus sedimenti]
MNLFCGFQEYMYCLATTDKLMAVLYKDGHEKDLCPSYKLLILFRACSLVIQFTGNVSALIEPGWLIFKKR